MNTTKAVEEFIKYLSEERGRNTNTLRNYNSYLSKSISELKSENTDDITVDSISTLKRKLIKKGLSKKTINYYLTALRIFIKFLFKKKIPVSIHADEIELFYKTPDKKIELITPDELKQFLSVEVSPISDLLVNLLYSTGMRIHELHNLKIDEIRMDSCSTTIVGKGGKERLVFLSQASCALLKQYIGERKNGPIFIDENEKPFVIRTLQRILSDRANHVKLSHRVTAHTLRHLFASNLLTNGADIRSVQDLLGHSSITTTQRYTHISNKVLEETYKKFHT